MRLSPLRAFVLVVLASLGSVACESSDPTGPAASPPLDGYVMLEANATSQLTPHSALSGMEEGCGPGDDGPGDECCDSTENLMMMAGVQSLEEDDECLEPTVDDPDDEDEIFYELDVTMAEVCSSSYRGPPYNAQCTPRPPNGAETTALQAALGYIEQHCGLGDEIGAFQLVMWDGRVDGWTGPIYGTIDEGASGTVIMLWSGDMGTPDELDLLEFGRTLVHEYGAHIFGMGHGEGIDNLERSCGYEPI